ncbi:MAG: efflux RND transporter permease subunit [bacterium]
MSSLGFSGNLAKHFQANEITPLIALVGLLLGLFAIFVTPREEEPQIDVTFANIFISMPGASAREVENIIAFPAEQVLDEIDGIKHVYSVSQPGQVVLTVEFEVGLPRNEVIVRLYNEVFSNLDWLPQGLGASQPLIRPMGIDDVPIVSATLWTENLEYGAYELKQVAHAVEAEIKRISDTRDVYTVGGPENIVRITLDPQKLNAYGLSVQAIQQALVGSNLATHSGSLIKDNKEQPVQTGELLANADEIKQLVISVVNNRPIYLEDVANIIAGPEQPDNYVSISAGMAWTSEDVPRDQPAVTIAVAKKPGTNAVDIADQVIKTLHNMHGTYIPDDVHIEITRNYGKTANDKAQKLIHKLIFATASVVLLVLATLGWREAIVVGSAVVLTLAITLFASWAWGFTLNRVSLFALIFSIGILVDDAVVVVENIHRHRVMTGHPLLQCIPPAVAEVGGPTILATLTVIAALLPMAFVTGLMGPYMSPIPINASIGMLISLAIALIVTPWLSYKLLSHSNDHSGTHQDPDKSSALTQFFTRILSPFLGDSKGARALLFGGMAALVILSSSLAFFEVVVLKMLPFDNKSEFQVVVDMPEGTPLEKTNALIMELTDHLTQVPEVHDIETYAGTAAPINFNGLVRQYYLRQGTHMGDLQVNLTDKHKRERKSHEIALQVRPELVAIGAKYNASVKVVEVPPGPPVMSPLVAEIYGPDYSRQQSIAKKLVAIFKQTDNVVDTDTSVESDSTRNILVVDRQRAALLGVSQSAIAQTIKAALHGFDATYLHDPNNKYPVPVRLELDPRLKGDMDTILQLPVTSTSGKQVTLSELVSIKQEKWEQTIYHKDLLPVVFVTGDVAGGIDSPLYGLFKIVDQVNQTLFDSDNAGQYFIEQPENAYQYGIKWDGEWQVTYETFRDMGLAYSIGLIMIYLLVVAQFKSYFIPIVIMIPIPLTIIGVMPGHALAGAQFTATSMIGMIALAGIIVRNSILLVDFINHSIAQGKEIRAAVIEAAAVRTKPIMLTAVAAMMGAFFILDDPIFNGLAVSLISGILVSTVLTLVVIPVMYYSYLKIQQKKSLD